MNPVSPSETAPEESPNVMPSPKADADSASENVPKPSLESDPKSALESDPKSALESDPKSALESDLKLAPPGFDPKPAPEPDSKPAAESDLKPALGCDLKLAPPGFFLKPFPPGFEPKPAPPGFDSKPAPPGFDSKPAPPGFDSKPAPPGFGLKPAPESDTPTDPDPSTKSNPGPSSETSPSLPAQGSSEYDRFVAIRDLISLDQQMLRVRDLACPVYVFVADLVQYVTRYYSNASTVEWDFNHEFTHTSTLTHFNYKVQNAVDACCKDRQICIHLTYSQCFPKGCPSVLHFQNATEVLKGAVSTRVINTVLHLIEFCCFVAQFSAHSFGSGLISAPYRALDIIHSNVLEFLRNRGNGQTDLLWNMLVPACRVIEIHAEDRSFFKILSKLLMQRGEDINWVIGLQCLSLSE